MNKRCEMNVSELKPIDARVMKPGDPVVKRNGTGGKLYSVIEAADPSYQAVILWDDGVVHGYTLDGKRFVDSSETVAFFPPDPDPIDPSPGNVARLRKSQVGQEWRIPAHDEKPDRRAMVWRSESWDTRYGYGAYQKHASYRVPIAPIRMVPLSMEDFIGKPWPLVRVQDAETVYAVVGVRDYGLWAGDTRAYIPWSELRELHELSHDHGVTWVKAEKEEQT